MEKKLQLVEQRLQSERCDSARSNSLTDLPPLSVSEAQSPQSSGLPSGNVSTIEEPVHTTPISIKTPNSDVTVVETDRTYIDEEGQPVAHASTQHVN
jgi:mRNA-binding protein PUF3